jgi:hypothetical protein
MPEHALHRPGEDTADEEREEPTREESDEKTAAAEGPQPLDSGTVMALQAADPHTRARALLSLQRSHGNEAVQRVIRSLQTTDAGRDARVQSIGDRAEEPAPSGQFEKAVLYREAIAAELDVAPAASKTERDLVQDNVNTVGQIFANYQAALHLFEEAVMDGAGERVPRELAVELLREVSRQVFDPVLDACVGVAPGMEDLVAEGMGKIEDVPERETIEPGMSAPAHALRNLVIAERHRVATSQGNLIKGQISLMRLAEDRAVRGDPHHGMLVSAAIKLDELETSTHSASGILKLIMERWNELSRGPAAVLIVLDENWRVTRAHIKMSDGRRLASQLLQDNAGNFDLNELKLPRQVTWEASDLARCQALLDPDGRIRELDRNEKGGAFFDDFTQRLRSDGLPRTKILSGD